MKGNKIFDFSRVGFQDIINIMTKKINECVDIANDMIPRLDDYISKVDWNKIINSDLYQKVLGDLDKTNEQMDNIAIEVQDINVVNFNDNKKYLLKNSQNINSLVNILNKKNISIDGYNNILNTINLTQGYNLENCSNLTIENIIFDFNKSTTKGLKFKNCNNVIVRNVTFKNIKEKATTEGYLYALDFLGCKDVLVENCKFVNIDGSTSANGVARCIQVENDGENISDRIIIDNCVFDTVLPVTDADAIHFNQPNAPINALVRKCTFIDCAKRGVKAQAPSVIVEKCTFYDVNYLETVHDSAIIFFYDNCKAIDNNINYINSNRGIFIYNSSDISNITVRDNCINIIGTGLYDAISIGIVNDVRIYSNIEIKNNKIFGNGLRYSIYMPHCINSLVDNNYIESGAFVLGLTDQTTYYTENIKVINNTIKSTVLLRGSIITFQNNLFETGISIDSTVTNTTNVIIDNNIFRNCNYGVVSSTNNISGYKITNNTFKNITTKDIQINGAEHIIENNIYDKLIGGSHTKYNQGSIDFNPGTLNVGSGITSPGITVPGARLGDFVVVSAPYNLKNCIAHAYVSSSSQVQIRVQNLTSNQVDFVSGIWKVKVIKS